MRNTLLITILSLFFISLSGQSHEESNEVIQTFRHSRIISSHSVETLPARKLDFRIVHRFGDLAGDNGGWPTFYGLENAADVSIGFEYGITDRIMVGISRTKGVGPLRQNINTLAKAKIISQGSRGNFPVSMAVIGMISTSTMQRSELEGTITSFEKTSHRVASHLGLHIARKFSPGFSAQFNAQWTYRNIVLEGDDNGLASIGGGFRAQLTQSIAVLTDVTFPLFSDLRTTENGFYPSVGIGFEFDTRGGHVFQLNLTNSQGSVETAYIPFTRSNWADGEFRIGFTISRLFNL